MAARRRFLLLVRLIALALTGAAGVAAAQDAGIGEPAEESVIEPDVEQSDAKLAAIDTENFEIGAYFGLLNIEDFGTNEVYGARAAYHINELLFLEGVYGYSEAGDTLYETLTPGVRLLTDEDRQYTYYNVSLGINVLPGESYFGAGWGFTNAFYLIAGVGSTSFAGEDFFTTSFGAGYRLLFNDWLALHIDGRDHVFQRDLFGEDRTTHNLEFHGGLTVFF
ncbi:outer membrane beta-barrel domain-containing protein [Ectothiorhodospiraceae bacterium WFHF3C12]|nr:outer membrane beta-barrel domain-containing protein [Ectothiorhodospiraceae bacterium WFHF3C12]